MVYGNEYGEIGTVYQGAGVDYVGVMRAGGRAAVAINGHRISERQASPLAGTRGAARWRALASMRCRCHDARADTAARSWRDDSPDIRSTRQIIKRRTLRPDTVLEQCLRAADLRRTQYHANSHPYSSPI
jgi:hypothetical protein